MEGERCMDIHFIEKGIIKAVQLKDGKEVNLDFCFEHVFVTNLKSLRSDGPSEYHLQAVEASATISFNKSGLFKLYAISREIESWGRALLESLPDPEKDKITPASVYYVTIITGPAKETCLLLLLNIHV